MYRLPGQYSILDFVARAGESMVRVGDADRTGQKKARQRMYIPKTAMIVIGILVFCLCVLGVAWVGAGMISRHSTQKRGRGARIVGGAMNAIDPMSGLPRGISDPPPVIEYIEEGTADNKAEAGEDLP
jgi:hypothetical protein